MMGRRLARWHVPLGFLMVLSMLATSLVAATPGTQAQSTGSVRVFFIRDGKIAAARRTQVPQDISIYNGAMIELLRGPRPDERAAGLTTAFNELITTTADVTYDEAEKLATVDFGPELSELTGQTLVNAMAQTVFTLTQFSEIDDVAFSIDGEPIQAFDGSGVPVDHPVRRSDYEGVTPAIFVESPEVLTTARSPIRIRGTANTFEATFNYVLYDGSNNLLAEGFVTATSGSGTRGRFNEEITYELAAEQRGTLIVYESSAKDGAWVNVVAIPLTLRATVQATATPTVTPTATATSTPTATATSPAISSRTPTATVQPGETPLPRPTQTPTAVSTARPTDVPKPTNTAVPTETPKPTQTPKPTATPTPTAIPTVWLTIKVMDCPPGMGIDDLNPSECGPLSSGFDFRLTSQQHGIDLTTADAMRAGLNFRWTDLPYGTYLLRSLKLPESSSTFFIPRSISVEGSAGSGYSISLDEVSGNLTVTIYILNRWVEIVPFR